MRQEIQVGSLLCSVLITWAILQEPSMPSAGQLLSLPPPPNKNKWVHPDIFEPQPKIQLTRSSYKVTSFLDFQPFLDRFMSVYHYLENFKADLNNPEYTQRLVHKDALVQISPLSNDILIYKYFSSVPCRFNPYACTSKLQIDQYKLEIQYVDKVFHATYRKFLTAIDHIDYHPSQIQNATRKKRSEEYAVHGYYHSYARTLTPSEEIFLDKFLIAMQEIYPSLHQDLSRIKRFGILTWIFGWGVFSNTLSIRKIKENLHTLQRQNQFQDKQIRHLAKDLNLTMHHVSRHEEILYEMDTKMFIMNKTIQGIMMGLSFLWYESDLLAYFQARVLRLHSSLYVLKEDLDSLYEYIRVLASQELNPLMIPPDILKTILNRVMEDIKSNARLRLSEDPKTNIWAYYGNIKLTPIVLQDYLMLILTVPLIEQSLQMNLYKVYNLPMLHPKLNVHAQYEIEGTYLATLMEGMFISLPSAIDIKLCLMTAGHLCIFDQVFYPVERINWCIYALFINDYVRIRRDCLLKTLARTTNLAYSLD